MTRLAILVLAVGTLAGCDRHARPSDQSADEVVAKQKDVNADTATTHRKAAELDHAAAAFNLRREVRLMGLHSEYSMIAPQANMIESLSAQLPFTDDARKDIDAKVDTLQQRAGEAQTKITELDGATPAEWRDRDDAADQAMKKLESARDDAWKAFHDAKRSEHRSS